MSSTTQTSSDVVPSIDGSCHCGSVKFVAKNVDLNALYKCNCTFCNRFGRIGVYVKPGDLTVFDDAGKAVDFTVENSRSAAPTQLSYYAPKEEHFKPGESEGYHHFCRKCGVHTFVTGNVQFLGGSFISINVRCLDLEKVERDFKDVTEPVKVSYLDGLSSTYQKQKGSPWKGGAY